MIVLVLVLSLLLSLLFFLAIATTPSTNFSTSLVHWLGSIFFSFLRVFLCLCWGHFSCLSFLLRVVPSAPNTTTQTQQHTTNSTGRCEEWRVFARRTREGRRKKGQTSVEDQQRNQEQRSKQTNKKSGKENDDRDERSGSRSC